MFSLVPLITVLAQYPLVVMGANSHPSADGNIPTEQMARLALSATFDGEAASSSTSAYDACALAGAGTDSSESAHLLETFDGRVSAAQKACDNLLFVLRKQKAYPLLTYAKWHYLTLDSKPSKDSRFLTSYIKSAGADPEYGYEAAARTWATERPEPYFLREVVRCYRSLLNAFGDILSEYCRRESETKTGVDGDAFEKFRLEADIDCLLGEIHDIGTVDVQRLWGFHDFFVEQINLKAKAMLYHCQDAAWAEQEVACWAMDECAGRLKEAIGCVSASQNCADFIECATALLSVNLDEALAGSEENRLESIMVDTMVKSIVDDYTERGKARCYAVRADYLEDQKDFSSEDTINDGEYETSIGDSSSDDAFTGDSDYSLIESDYGWTNVNSSDMDTTD
ncbi:hypothetical protein PAPHI01_1452 [Pancytospora philotis]|nr:hypothetical protein PAPHI01_1452 [Pancytospora philotis]